MNKYDIDFNATADEIERLLGYAVETAVLACPESRKVLADKLEKLGADKDLLESLRR